MPAELTRFDFHVYRFLESNTVESMTDAEIGQYFLLLCKAFISGKAASLPNDARYLAKWARCKKVSRKVLAKFPLVDTEWGPRRRNDTMYGEWLVATERSASASERGKKGGLANSLSQSTSNGEAIASASAQARAPAMLEAYIPTHTKPVIPDQSDQLSQGVFKTIRAHWYRYFTKDLSTSKRNKEQYAAACSTYGEDRVLAYLEIWARANAWVASHPKGENRLYVFLAALPSMVAGDEMRTSSENEQKAEEDSNDELIQATIAADKEQIARENAEFLKKQEADAALAKLSEGVPF